MNTGKQIRIMVVIMFLTLIAIGAYTLWDPFRADSQTTAFGDQQAEFGAQMFAQNCRPCHGDVGEGGAKAGRLPAALPLDTPKLQGHTDPNDPNSPITQAAKNAAMQLVTDTATCGRVGTAMPAWGDTQGGPLNSTQIQQIATMIVNGRWDLARKEAEKADAQLHATPAAPQNPSITDRTCGQVNRGGAATGASPTPAPSQPPAGAQVIDISAFNVQFDQTEIHVKPGTVFVRFTNKDAGVQHNFAVYTDDTASKPLADGSVGPLSTGGPDVVVTLVFQVTQAGNYFFRCDVHPTIMTGKFIVDAG